ncbi:hypothetical protein QC823_13365 [Halomonas vilamensis]|uniref:Uncharacterized protein n=1 Tax=Vreelandella vilamensis TaxID=531309 RepID=A0ABU1H6P8_9GAMM|nr:hypothetical protein [Halomonas vilamensis]MDR5899975.1 hypothetical protein [Halomonas vilamensis]
MPDDRQPFGLDIPANVQRKEQSRGLIAGAIKDGHNKKEMADHLAMTSEDGGVIHGKEMLLQMAYELRQLPISNGYDSTASEYSADMCLNMVRQLWENVPDEQLEPMSQGQFLLMLGYLYGKLTMPSHIRHSRALEAEIKMLHANLKRQQGGKASADIKQAETAQRVAYAKRVWDELRSGGRPERGLASIVAKRVGVTPKTIREWRKRLDWRNETNE